MMKRIYGLSVLLCIMTMLFACNGVNGSVEKFTGWSDSMHSQYIENDIPVKKQWVQENDDWYYMDEYGNGVKDKWVLDDSGKYYYCDSDGKMIKNTIHVDTDGKMYVLDVDGSMRTSGQITDNNGIKYNINSDGTLTKVDEKQDRLTQIAYKINNYTATEEEWIEFYDSYNGKDGATFLFKDDANIVRKSDYEKPMKNFGLYKYLYRKYKNDPVKKQQYSMLMEASYNTIMSYYDAHKTIVPYSGNSSDKYNLYCVEQFIKNRYN